MAKKRASKDSKDEEFLASLADGSLYSMGAYFSDQHPELVDEVIAQAEAIEGRGLRGYASDTGMSVEEAYETLMTGLAVRYYNAVAG
jgi:dolichyl-phosphate-mannose--protein O-mannosyl transferase